MLTNCSQKYNTEFIIFEYTVNVIKRGKRKRQDKHPEIKEKRKQKMKMYELKKLTDRIEEETGRKVKMVGETLSSGRAIIHFYFNDWMVHTYFLDELYHELNTFCILINALKYGKNPLEF